MFSIAAPTIACLVAYWRGLPGIKNGWDEELKKPANVKKLLMYMHRPLFPGNRVDGLDESKVGANKNKPKGRDLVPSATPSPFRRAQQMSPAPRNLQDAVPSAPVSTAARPPQRTHRPPCHPTTMIPRILPTPSIHSREPQQSERLKPPR